MNTSPNDQMFLTPQGKHVVMDLIQNENDKLRAVNADLLAVAVAVAEHFADTDAPLGAQARAAIARATGAA